MNLKVYLYVLIVFTALMQAKSIPIDEKSTQLILKQQIIDEYKIALNHFKNKNYKKSYDLFNKLFETNLNDPNINFYLGRSAFELKKYHEAIVAYERVLFEKPDSFRTKLEMGKAYLFNNSLESAKSIFVELKTTKDISKEALKTIEQYLVAIDKKIDKHSLSGIVMVGVNYDSNVNNRASDDIYDDSSINTTGDAKGFAHQDIVLLNYGYKESDIKLWKHDVMVFYKKIFEVNYKNAFVGDKYTSIKLASYNPALNIKHNEKLTVDYGVFIDNLWINGVSIMKTYGLLPKVTYIANEKNTLISYIKLQQKSNHKQSDKINDSKYSELSVSLTHLYSKKMSFNSSFLYSYEWDRDVSKKDGDISSYLLKYGMNYILNPVLTFSPFVSYKLIKYKNSDGMPLPSGQVKEKNQEFKVGISSTYVYSPKWIVQTSCDYTIQKSNKQSNEYDKYTFGFNIIRPF